MSLLKEPIDCKKLEEELYQALREDELYELRNEAKIRAVEQRVPTYNDFREMVNAAHLKPLDRADLKNKIAIPKNNFANRSADWILDNETKNNSESVAPLSKNDENYKISAPKNSKEFMEAWNRIDPNSKFEYLLEARMYLGRKIFITEVPCELLEAMIDICSEQFSEDKINEMIDLFIQLSQCNRFQLNLAFLNCEKKAILRQLLQKLISTGENESQKLSEKYEMILK